MSKTLSQTINFTADETKLLPFRPGWYAIEVSGDLGGGSLAVSTENDVPYEYTFTDIGMYGFTLITPFTNFSLLGATNPNCDVRVVDLYQRTL